MNHKALRRFFLLFLVPFSVQATDIADTPMAVQNLVKPNIMVIFDNSGSMEYSYLPDDVDNVASNNCYKNSDYNRIYYNPNVVYLPGLKADGSSYPNADFNKAPTNGYTTNSTTVDLARNFKSHSGDTAAPAYYYKTNNYSGSGSLASNSCTDKITVSSTSGPNKTDERTNFANWYSYHRTRILATKTALSRSFVSIDNKYRVGLFTMNDNNGEKNTSSANFIALADFASCALSATCQKNTWYSNMLALTTKNGRTPTGFSMDTIGKYYQNAVMPGLSSVVDPITDSCQSNYQIVATDGYWNETQLTKIGNTDKTLPASLPAPVPLDNISGTPLTPGTQFPRPFYEGPTATSNTLADIAMKYWISDLRPAMTNNVPANSLDPATWQHMTTFAIALGAEGKLAHNAATEKALKNGTQDWPVPVNNDPTGIDDLWHATVNGHGKYLNATDPQQLQLGLSNILAEIVNRSGSAAAVAVSNPNISTNDNITFASSYNSGTWSGDLNAYALNLTTGAPITNNMLWSNGSAQAQLDRKAWSTRYIATYVGNAGMAFTASALPSNIKTKLNTPGQTDADTVINFLRGDRSQEGILYRQRAHVLGDIVNAEPVYVAGPSANYVDAGFGAYKSSKATRTKMVYQAANDGLLHAFTAANGTAGGAEQWAYLPGILLNATGNNSSTSTLVNLSAKTGFRHLYYVDSTPVVGDIDTRNTLNGSQGNQTNWITLLVGGLGKGGRGYYALDISDPAASSDAAVVSKVKWEFPNSTTPANVAQNIGYSFGKPIIVKTAAAGWVVLVTSGYNNDGNGDGQGHLFVLNAATGALIRDIATPVGSSSAPSGLARISAYVDQGDFDNTTDFVYGGDLLGNLWRFDLSASNSQQWNVTKLATLVDDNNSPQPITTIPEIGVVEGKRMVYVGTGRYLGTSDVPATNSTSQTQTFYGLVDDKSPTPLINPVRSNLQQQIFTVSGSSATLTNNPVDLSVRKGWYVNLPNSNERSVSDPVLALGVLSFTTIIPSNEVCKPGGSAWYYAIDYTTGGAIPSSNVNWSGQSLGDTVASSPVLVKLPNGQIVGLITKSDGSLSSLPVPGLATSISGQRKLWREIINQ